MQPVNQWPVQITHEKCQSDVYGFVNQICVERTGKLILKCECRSCNEDFELEFSMLELCATSALLDHNIDKLTDLQDTPTSSEKPN